MLSLLFFLWTSTCSRAFDLITPKRKWFLNEIAILTKLSIWYLFFAQTSWCCAHEVELLFSHLCSWPQGPNQDFSQRPSSTVLFSSPVPFRQFQTCAHVLNNLICLFLQYDQHQNWSILRLHLYTVMSPIFCPSFHTPAVTPAATAAPRAVTWMGKHGYLGKYSFSTPTLW